MSDAAEAYMLALKAPEALRAMADVGVHVRLVPKQWPATGLIVSGLKKALYWQRYIEYRKNELVWCLIQKDRALRRRFAEEANEAYRAGLSREEENKHVEPINRRTGRKRR